MRIAIDVRSLMEGRHSGVEEYTYRITDAMIRIAPLHHYVLFYNSARPVRLPTFSQGNVTVRGLRYPNKLFNIAQFVTEHPKWDSFLDADVFFVPSPRLVPLSVHTPLVTVVHDLSFERFPEFLDLRRRVWHRLMRPRTLLRNSDHVIAVSEHTKRDVHDLYDVASQNISVVHSGVSSGVPRVSARDIHRVKQMYNLPERFILYFGALEPRKNVLSIVDAFSAIAHRVPHSLVIAGESGWLEHGVHAAVKRSDAVGRIHHAGFVREEDKFAVYAAADAFVYPSFYEGFGFPPLEAMLAGTPAIASFNSALAEVVGDWAYLVDPYNTGQLAHVMKELVQDGRRVPIRVRREIAQRYSWEAAAKQTVRILERSS